MRKILTLIALIVLIASCKKDANQGTISKDPVTHYPAETAYPGVHGGITSFRYGNDTIYVEKKGDKYVWMGDIVWDQATYDSMRAAGAVLNKKRTINNVSARTFTNDPTHIWPLGAVYYTIASGFTANDLANINAAINHWRNNTVLTFTQRTNQSNYILIAPGSVNSGLYSNYIGMKGGQQLINLESGRFGSGEVIHEIGHSVGLIHEQCRVDRGNTINVNYDNVTPHTSSNIYQFQTYAQQGQSGTQIGAFDINSIMMYGSFDFSDNVHPTITLLDGSTFFAQRFGLSAGDLETIRYIYQPIYARETWNTTESDGDDYYNHREGYVTVDFYQDAANTIRATLPYPVTLNYATISTRDCSGSSTVISPNSITIPAGTPSQIVLGYFSYTYSYNAAEDPVSCSSDDLGLSSGVGYRVQ